MRPISDAVAASLVRQKCVRSRSQTTLTKFCPLLTTYLPPEDNVCEGKIVDISSITYIRGCQIGMQGPQLCELDMATSRMAILDLNLQHVLQVATSNQTIEGTQ